MINTVVATNGNNKQTVEFDSTQCPTYHQLYMSLLDNATVRIAHFFDGCKVHELYRLDNGQVTSSKNDFFTILNGDEKNVPCHWNGIERIETI